MSILISNQLMGILPFRIKALFANALSPTLFLLFFVAIKVVCLEVKIWLKFRWTHSQVCELLFISLWTIDKRFDGIQMPTVIEELWCTPHQDGVTGSSTINFLSFCSKIDVACLFVYPLYPNRGYICRNLKIMVEKMFGKTLHSHFLKNGLYFLFLRE